MNEFEYHAFISYCHRDNQTFSRDEKGFVTSFKTYLEIYLGRKMPEPPRIAFDLSEFRGNHPLDSVIAAKVRKSMLFIPILSPPYLGSRWCKEELDTFIQFADEHGGLMISDQHRIIKVLPTDFPLDEHPDEIRNLPGHKFYSVDADTKKERSFYLGFGREIDSRYWSHLEDLANEICETLKIMGGQTPSKQASKTVFLATTTEDLEEERKNIRRELLSQHYQVLPPEGSMPFTHSAVETLVRANLRETDLSVHLIGKQSSWVPEGSSRSMTQIQHDLAGEMPGKRESFARITWIPAGLVTTDTRQQEFIDALRKEPKKRPVDDLLESSNAQLKEVVLDRLQRRIPNPLKKPKQNPLRIYIINEPRDAQGIQALEAYLSQEGFNLLKLQPSKDAITQNRTYLEICDTVLLIYGHGTQEWFENKSRVLTKARGYRSPMRTLEPWVYVMDPPNKHKEDVCSLRNGEKMRVITHFGGFVQARLAEYVAWLRQHQEHSHG